MHSLILASTTTHGVLCAQSLTADPRFEIVHVLTPAPKPVGRKQQLTSNPVHHWAQQNNLGLTLIQSKLSEISATNLPSADFLLVVDFGYFIPQWLLNFPTIAPVNIHPSALPKYRGASPGQFVLLSGDKNSAVSLIKMNKHMDQGDIIAQIPFTVDFNWNQQDYYQFAFNLIAPLLPNILDDFALKKIVPTVQPLESPTPLARQLNKSDSFASWSYFATAMQLEKPKHDNSLSSAPANTSHNSLLTHLLEQTKSHDYALLLERACRAFSGWPELWTIYQDKRMKIIKCHVENNLLKLDLVKVEGKNATSFSP